MKKRVSLKDIADQLNVSKTTLSFIINGKAKTMGISDTLIKKVNDYIQEINYRPHHLAQSLRTGRTKIICLIIENISDPFFATLAGQIELIAYKKGYKILYGSTQNNTQKAKELIAIFRDRQVDGYIITPTEGLEDDIKMLLAEEKPVVLFDRYLETINTNYVVMDNYESTFKGVNYLIGKGYKNIAFVTIDSDQSQMKNRLSGYEKAMLDSKLTCIVKKINYPSKDESQVKDIYGLLKKHPEIDAMFFATNYLAIHGLYAIQKMNLEIPADIGIVAFDDHDIFKIYKPSITAVAQPIQEMSMHLVNIVLSLLDNDATTATQHIVVPAKLTIRKS